MPNGYIGRTNNFARKLPRASQPKRAEPERELSFETLAYRMCATFGTPEGEAARHAVLKRMGLVPAEGEVDS